MAIHSSIVTCEIPWTKEPDMLQYIWSQKSQTLFSNSATDGLESHPFLLGCQISWHLIFHSILLFLKIFYSMLSVEISPPTFLILFTWALSFLGLGRGLSILFTVSRNEHLVLLILFYFFKPLFVSSLVLFLSADFRFFFHFSLSNLAWKIPWMEEPDRLQSMGSQRVGHD